MLARGFLVLLCLIALLSPTAGIAQSYNQSEIKLFQTLNRQPSDLARYSYLMQVMPHLSASEQLLFRQLLTSSQDELGLYDQAVLGFPLKSQALTDLAIPTATDWQATDAADFITKMAVDRRIVMINEAHHNAHTRQLTLALLPRLRAMGFTYFAAEALGEKDPRLMQRGYPVKESGTEYLHEPIYGEIIREAIRLGFTIVPYDTSDDTLEAREIGQANNLYQRVFSKDPKARLFVHCGYAHIDKARDRLGKTEPMAIRLRKLTGLEPLSIDQTQFLEIGLDQSDVYHQLIASFQPKIPIVLVNRVSGKAWSASPKLYDVNVILPPSISVKSFGDKVMYGNEEVRNIADTARFSAGLTKINDLQRPSWLTLDGERQAVPINSILCRMHFPCVVEAHYFGESDDATAADRYAFMEAYTESALYLRPGRYSLHALDENNETLSEQIIQVVKH